MRALVERGKVLIVEETLTLPRVTRQRTGVDKADARLIAAEVEDGSCLQIAGSGGYQTRSVPWRPNARFRTWATKPK